MSFNITVKEYANVKEKAEIFIEIMLTSAADEEKKELFEEKVKQNPDTYFQFMDMLESQFHLLERILINVER